MSGNMVVGGFQSKKKKPPGIKRPAKKPAGSRKKSKKAVWPLRIRRSRKTTPCSPEERKASPESGKRPRPKENA